MSTTYDRIAGQSVERLCALSDGIFAVAMTLLVLDLRVPPEVKAAVHSEYDLWIVLGSLWREVVPYVMTFLTLSIFWNGQQVQLQQLKHSDRQITWIHLGFLFSVTILPFSTRLLADFILLRPALLVYWSNILMLGVWLFAGWRCAKGSGLLKSHVSAEESRIIERRILVAQALYAFGTALCLFDTYVSIAFIAAVQLNYAIAPGFRKRPK